MAQFTPELELSGSQLQQIEDDAAMWCDLWSANLHASDERFKVTRRAELYLRVGRLPMDKVLDALGVDDAGWHVRLSELREFEERNIAAYDAAGQDGA